MTPLTLRQIPAPPAQVPARISGLAKTSALAAATLALCLGITACSSSSKSTAASPPAAGTSSAAGTTSAAGTSAAAGGTSSAPASASGIIIKNFGFSGELTVKPGEKVTVTNEDSAAHTLTDKKTHMFDTGNIDGGGGTGSFTAPTTPGSYPFGCSYHPEMAGTLVVQG